ncbi:MAG TPA: hypothetical protein PLH72_10460 [Vicinamibacterales bacterium]|nr:hypothetical protein [Vicinamibacterales bacterium]
MDDFALTSAERALLAALTARGVRFLLVGLGAAVLEGAPVTGLGPFDAEYARAVERTIDGIPIRVLPLERIVASKRATNRPKDLAALPALEATLLARRQQ